jgi:hypothetical protein
VARQPSVLHDLASERGDRHPGSGGDQADGEAHQHAAGARKKGAARPGSKPSRSTGKDSAVPRQVNQQDPRLDPRPRRASVQLSEQTFAVGTYTFVATHDGRATHALQIGTRLS